MLDGEVLQLSRVEEVLDARREPAFVDVERRVPEIRAQTRQPDDQGEDDRESQRDPERMGTEEAAPLLAGTGRTRRGRGQV